jgi:hypothetical protein
MIYPEDTKNYEVVSDEEWGAWKRRTPKSACAHCGATDWAREYFGDPATRIGAVVVWCANCRSLVPSPGMVRMRIPEGVPIRTTREPSKVPADAKTLVSREEMDRIRRARDAVQRRLDEWGIDKCPHCQACLWAIDRRNLDSTEKDLSKVICMNCHRRLG